MKRYLTILMIGGILGCAKPHTSDTVATHSPDTIPTHASEKPSDVVVKIYDAINRHDTTALKSMVSTSRLEYYNKTPNAMQLLLAHWQKRTATFKPEILSENVDGTVSSVTYKVNEARGDTTYHVQLYLENGHWKFGSM